MTRLFHFTVFLLGTGFLVGCGDADPAPTPQLETSSESVAMSDEDTLGPDDRARAALQDGSVILTVDRMIAEENACLMMMSVVNGLEEPANAGIFAFTVTGNGESTGGNMFPQTANPGDVQTGQIVLPGADCENVQVIADGQVNCTLPESGGATCLDTLELRDGLVEFDMDVVPVGE